MARRFSEKELWDFVNRADTHEKIAIAEAFLRKLSYIDNKLWDGLMGALAAQSRELYWMEKEEQRYERNYTSLNPWDAPGMRVSDFL